MSSRKYIVITQISLSILNLNRFIVFLLSIPIIDICYVHFLNAKFTVTICRNFRMIDTLRRDVN